jgi:hypothetical protein
MTRGEMTVLFDEAGVRKTLARIIKSGAVFEVRALDAELRGSRRTDTVSGYFDNVDACLSELEKLTTAKGIYFTFNPVNAALLARRENRLAYAEKNAATNDQHILQRRWLLLDVDADRPSGISASDSEKEAAHKKAREIHDYLKGLGWPLPVAADSGNGYHLLYRVDLPCDDGKLLEQLLAALATRFDGDGAKLDRSVHNPSRIVRLYGGRAAKGDNTEERPHRMSKILLSPLLKKVTAEQLQALVDELQPAKPPIVSTGQNDKPDKASIREMLAVIPKRPDYRDWIQIVAAVGDALSDDDAVGVLNEWSPEEHAGEYLEKLHSGFTDIHVGTLIHLAKLGGWEPPVDLWKGPNAPTDLAPIVLLAPPAPYEPPPLDLLPPMLQKFVHIGARSIDVDVAFLFLPLLSEIAACIGISRSVRIKAGWIQPPILLTAVVAPSGDGKDPAMHAAIEPQRLHEFTLKIENDENIKDYKKRLAEWKATKKSERGQQPEPPLLKTCLMDDATLEAVARRANDNDSGILLAKPELSHWFGSFDQYRDRAGADLARWLQLYDGILFAMDRVTGNRNYRIPNPRIPIAAGVQPDTLRRILTDEYFERGLPARFLWAMPERDRARKYTKTTIPAELSGDVRRLLSRLRELDPNEDEESRLLMPVLLPLNLEAEKIFTDFYNEVGGIIYQSELRMAAQWSKLIGGVARLALIGQLAHNPDAQEISGEIMNHACALARWFGNEADRIFSKLAETAEQRALREFCQFVTRHGGTSTIREAMQNFRPFRSNREKAEQQFNAAVRAGLAKWEPVPTTPKGGKPTRQIRLNQHPSSTQLLDLRENANSSVDVDNGRYIKNKRLEL